MDYTKFDDQALLRLIIKKDENALGELYDRFGRLVYSIALNALGDPALAEEVTQDVFFRIWEKAESYRSDHGKVVTWMSGITRNRAVDEIRRQKIRPEAMLAPWAIDEAGLQDGSAGLEAEIELKQQKNRVRRAIAQLPEEQRPLVRILESWKSGRVGETGAAPLSEVVSKALEAHGCVE